MKGLFAIGLNRPIEDDDIDMVPKDLQCERNKNAFAHQWNLELKKPNPSMLRTILKQHVKVIPIGILYAITETLAR